MAVRTGSREQFTFLPSSIEDYVAENDPVRAYDAMIDSMDIEVLGLNIDHHKVGNSSYDPISMLKLLVYGYSYGWRSSRKLERATHHNLSFIWLMGGLKPDHKTISNFRKNNKKVLQKVLKQSVRICIELNLIEGNCLFLDSTKIKGASSTSRTVTKSRLQEKLSSIDKRIETLIDKCDEIDNQEDGSYVELNKELQDGKVLKSKIQDLIKKMDTEDLKKINETDPDTSLVKGRQGYYAGYNSQVVTDELNGLIVSSDVVNDSTDLNQFSNQISKANSNLEDDCNIAVADAGYAKVDDIIDTVKEGIDVITPSQKQALHNPKESPFSKDKFLWDSQNNQYICPEDKVLKYSRFKKEKNHYAYRVENAKDCLRCPHFGKCTRSKNGRQIIRLKNEELKERLEARYSSNEGQAIYKKRKLRAELPFGHIKQNIDGRYFLLKGLESAKAEFSILTSCFNITRMITLLGGVINMVNVLKAN